MIDVRRLPSSVAEGLEAIRAGVVDAEIFAAWNEQLIVRLNDTSDIPCHGIQEPKSSTAYGVCVLATYRDGDALQIGFGSESGDMSVAGVQRALEKVRHNAVHDPDVKSLPSPTGKLGLHIMPPLLHIYNHRALSAVMVSKRVTCEDLPIDRTERTEPSLPANHRGLTQQEAHARVVDGGDCSGPGTGCSSGARRQYRRVHGISAVEMLSVSPSRLARPANG